MDEPNSGPNTVNFDVRPWKPSCGGGHSNFDDPSGDGRFFDQRIGGQTPAVSEESRVKGTKIREESSNPILSLRSSNDHPTLACEDDEEVTSERKACGRALRAKKGGCARVDNLSKRRRRERINGKIRMLQELIPNCCSKADKASMLEEAIQYLKILRLHLQMMCLRSRVVCGYRPMVAWAVEWRVSSGVGGPLISSILPQPQSQPFQMLGRPITRVPYLPVYGAQSLLPT